MEKIFYILLFLFLFNFYSCKLVDQNQLKRNKKINLINSIKANQIHYNSFSAKFSAKVYSSNKIQRFLGSLKINDSLSIISIKSNLGIELFKIILTNDSVKITSLFTSSKHFSYKDIYKTYGFYVSKKIINNVLVNQLFSYPDTISFGNYQMQLNDTLVTLLYKQPVHNNQLLTKIKHSIVVNTQNFKIIKHEIWDFSNFITELYISYNNFKPLSTSLFPYLIKLTLIQTDTLSIEIKFKNIRYK